MNLKKSALLRSLFVSTLVLASSVNANADWTISKNYNEVHQFFANIAAKYSQTTKLISIGQSDTGEPIDALRVGHGKLETLVVATHHGNEFGSTELAKAFALEIAKSPIQGQTVTIIPVLNISGYNARNRYEKGVDPNRDYPGPCVRGTPVFKLKSTKALAEYIATHNVIASATLHTFSSVVVYPWGISTRDLSTPYDKEFADLARVATNESGYKSGNNTELLYPADGTFEDYVFWKHGIWSLLFELGKSHTPNQAAVEEIIRGNVPGLKRFLAQAPAQLADRHDFTGKCDNRLKGMRRERLE